MSNTCETVIIETENGPVTINKSDYDPKTHTLQGEKKEPVKRVIKSK
jgi:hypothetical protein